MAFEVRELNSQGGQGGSSTVNLYLGELKEEEFKRLEKLVGQPGEDLIKKIEMVLWENFELKRQVADLEAKYPGPSFLEWKDQRFDDLQKKFDDLEASREETERGCEQALKDQQEATEVAIALAAKQLAATKNLATRNESKMSELLKKI